MTVLITGGAGLVGSALSQALRHAGHDVAVYDCAVDERDDVRDHGRLARAVASADGVVHLAAVSRVVWAYENPERCWAVNVDGTAALMASLRADQWVVFASSREVYGTPAVLPARERSPLAPLNVYARAKVAGEQLVGAHSGAKAVIRLSNAYGPVADHFNRVVPAFARAAALGRPVRVDGAARTFDFVHLSDAVSGLARVVERVCTGASVETVHLTTGVGTSLGALARLALEHGASAAEPGPERSYDVERFIGDPGLAAQLLDWRAQVPLELGFSQLVEAFRAA